MSATAAIAVASTRSLRNHLRRTFGGAAGARLAILAGLAVVVALNALLYAFYSQNFAGVFGAHASPQIAQVRGGLVQTQLVTTAAIALMLVVFAPTGSGLSVGARIAGARPRQIAIGEYAPTTGGLCIAATAAGAGPAWFEAQQQPAPLLTFITLLLSGVAFAIAALVVCHTFAAVANVVGVAGATARLVGIVGGFVGVGLLLIDVLVSLAEHRSGAVDAVVRLLWGGERMPTDARAALIVLAVVAVGLLADLGAVALGAPRETLERARRLVPLPRLGSGIAAFTLREVVLSLRHPVGQLGWLLAALLAVAMVALVRLGNAPPGAALIAFPLLFSTLSETAYGRSAPWGWVYRSCGLSYSRQVIGQWLGAALPSLLVCLGLLTAVVTGPADFVRAAPQLAVAAVSLASVAYVCGTVVPYSSGATAGMMLTSVLTLGAESAILYLASLAGPAGSIPAMLVELAVGALAVLGAIGIARKRGFSTGQN